MNKLEISVEELSQILKSDGPKPVLLDVREVWEFNLARIGESLNIPMGSLEQQVDELNKEDDIVIVCHHGHRSLNAAYFLASLGFKKVKSLKGGSEDWSVKIDPKVARY